MEGRGGGRRRSDEDEGPTHREGGAQPQGGGGLWSSWACGVVVVGSWGQLNTGKHASTIGCVTLAIPVVHVALSDPLNPSVKKEMSDHRERDYPEALFSLVSAALLVIGEVRGVLAH